MIDTPKTECRKCDRPYQLRPDSEPTDYCDECAHSIVSQIETELAAAKQHCETVEAMYRLEVKGRSKAEAEIERLKGENKTLVRFEQELEKQRLHFFNLQDPRADGIYYAIATVHEALKTALNLPTTPTT